MNRDNIEQARISGFVNSVLFSNESNGYKVLDIESEDGLELITAVGIMPDVEVGEKIQATGKWENHSTYGEQFSVKEYYRSVPDDGESMQRYLGSGVIKGVGEALAKKIVDRFGEQTFQVIDMEPERLAEIKGISPRMAAEIGEQFAAKAASREAMVYLESLGLTPAMSMKVYEALGTKTVSTVKSNPYIMAEKVEGISFRKADEIAVKNGLPMDSPARIRSAIRFVLMEAAGAGHTYLPRTVMEEYLYQTIGIGGVMVDNAYEQALMAGSVISLVDEQGRENVYLRSFFTAETKTARSIVDLAIAPVRIKGLGADTSIDGKNDFSDEINGLSERLKGIEKKLKISLSDEQRTAVEKSYGEGVVIITGGPGTGKTTIIRALLELLEEDGASYALAAPTGKAAKRMEEAAGVEARTIHRLLEVQAAVENEAGHMSFNRDEEHPLEYAYVIVDEMSMVDISLMSHLLRALVPGTHLVLLGDQDQLPSVGAGNVLRDLIRSGVIPVCRLTRIYRQTGDSSIVRNAHRINLGEYPVFDNRNSDFFLMREQSQEAVVKTMVDVIKVRFRKFYQCDPLEDMQVLSPMKKGPLGVRALNQQLQESLNPPSPRKRERRMGETVFRIGDKVMQIRNNYEMEWKVLNKYGIAVEEGKGVFNGDTGRVKNIENDLSVTVIFDGSRIVNYTSDSLSQLELAYAITIHKSQGTESPVIILPLLEGPDVLMSRNLLYTAVTRAKKYVVIIGREETVRRMVDQNHQAVRYSALASRVRQASAEMMGLSDDGNINAVGRVNGANSINAANNINVVSEVSRADNAGDESEFRFEKKKISLDLVAREMGVETKEIEADMQDEWAEGDFSWPDEELEIEEFDPDMLV